MKPLAPLDAPAIPEPAEADSPGAAPSVPAAAEPDGPPSSGAALYERQLRWLRERARYESSRADRGRDADRG